MHDYIELYTGEEFFLALKYSIVAKIIYTALLMGVLNPIAYIYGFISVAIFYVTERFKMHYCYKAPANLSVE